MGQDEKVNLFPASGPYPDEFGKKKQCLRVSISYSANVCAEQCN